MIYFRGQDNCIFRIVLLDRFESKTCFNILTDRAQNTYLAYLRMTKITLVSILLKHTLLFILKTELIYVAFEGLVTDSRNLVRK